MAPRISSGGGSTSNEAALILKLNQLTGGVDPEATDDAWIESLVVTSDRPLELDDANDDLKRELALCAVLTWPLAWAATDRAFPAARTQLQPGSQRCAHSTGAL